MNNEQQSAPPTSEQIRRFFRQLRVILYDRALERRTSVQYFVDADVAVTIMAGFEEQSRGSEHQQLVRALMMH